MDEVNNLVGSVPIGELPDQAIHEPRDTNRKGVMTFVVIREPLFALL